MRQGFLSWSSVLFPGCERHPTYSQTHKVVSESFWKVLEQLNKLSKPSQHKGRVFGLFEASSPTSGTQPLCLPKATCPKNWNFWVFFFPLEVGSGLVCCHMPQKARGLNSVKCKMCKKLCNLFNLLRRNSWPPSQALPIPCWAVLTSLWNWEPEISPVLLKCSLWKQNSRDTSKSFHLQWKL